MGYGTICHRVVAVLAAALIGGACEPRAADQRPAERVTSGAPWEIEDAQVNVDDGIRVLVLHDMEGLSGQDDPKTFDSKYFRNKF